MIRSEAEYQVARNRLDENRDFAIHQKAELEAEGYSSEEVTRGMEPIISFQAQIAEEIEWYERVRRGHIEPLRKLTDIGRILIALRISAGWSQRELADRLGVNEASVSRDERNEYHGVTVERAQRVLDAFGATSTTTVEVQEPTVAT